MSTPSWLRSLFATPRRYPVRKALRRVRLAVEELEVRVVPTVLTVTNTSGNPSMVGSLPYEVAQANADNQANTINFDPTVFSTPKTISLTGAQLELSDTAGTQTITGPAAGVTISGGSLSRVFQVDSLVTAAMSGLTISGGNAGSGNGGGLENLGATALTGCTVNGKSASGGGALYNAGTLTLTICTVGSLAGGGNVTLESGILTVGGDNTSTTYSGAISGTGGLTKAGTGTLTLSGTRNTYSGTTTINAGTLLTNAANALSPNSAVSLANVASAALNLNNFGNSIASLAGGGAVGGQVRLGTGTLSIVNAINGSNTTYKGVISGTGELTINLTGTGSPEQTLSGTNTFTGTTTIDVGTLAATATGALGPVGGGNILITPSAGNSAVLDLSALASLNNTHGAINLNSSAASSTAQVNTKKAITLSNAIGLTGPTNQFDVAANTTQLGGAITGTGALTVLGSGTLQLNGASNTYTGTTTIESGTLAATAAGALGPVGGGNILITPSAGDTAILDLSTLASLTNTNAAIDFDSSAASSTAQLNTKKAITLSNAIGLTGQSNQFKVAANTTQLADAITGTGGLTKLGAGTLQFNGASNIYSGTTTISAGTVQADATNALSANSAVSLANVASAVLNLNNFSNSIASLAGGGATGGQVTLGTGTLSIVNAINGSNTAYKGVISGTGGLTINLTGTGSPEQTLSGTNTYTGATTIDAGTLATTAAGALGPVGGGNIQITPSAGNTAILDLSALASLNTHGAINLNSSAASSTAQLNTSTAIKLSNGISLNGSTSQFDVAANTTQLAGIISGTGGLTNIGPGTLLLSGANTYSGGNNINSGTVKLANASALGAAAAQTVIAASAVLDVAGLSIAASLSLAGGALINSVSGSLASLTGPVSLLGTGSIGGGGGFSFFGIFSGLGGLFDFCAGSVGLFAADTYSGTTDVEAGTLVAETADALPSGTFVTVAEGAVLQIASGVNPSIGSLSGAGTVSFAKLDGFDGMAFSSTMTVAYGNFAGNLVGEDAALIVTGGLYLSGNNSLAAVTITNASSLFVESDTALSSNTAVTLAGPTDTLFVAKGVNPSVGSLTGEGIVSFAETSSTMTVGSGDFAGNFVGDGNLIVEGGSLSLSGNNSLAEVTIISSLSVESDTALSSNTSVTVDGSGNSLNVATGVNPSIASLAGNGAVFLPVTSTMTVAYGNFAGDFVGNGGDLIVNGGIMFLAGNNSLGAVTITNGSSLFVESDAALSIITAVTVDGPTDSLFVETGVNPRFASLTGEGSVNFSSPNSTVTISDGDFAGNFVGDGQLIVSGLGGGGRAYLSGNNSLGAVTIQSGSSLVVESDTALSSNTAVTVTGPADTLVVEFGVNTSVGSLTGQGLVSFGSPTSTMTVANGDFAGNFVGYGDLIVNGGELSLSGTNNLGAVTITNGSSLFVNANTALSGISGAAVTVTGPTDYLYIADGVSVQIASLEGLGNVVLGNGSNLVVLEGNFAGVISGGPGILMLGNVADPATVILSGANTYTGATDIEAGTLELGAADALPSGSAVTVAPGTVLDLAGNDVTVGALEGAGDVELGSGTLTVGAQGTFSGVISGTGGLTDAAPGAFTLAGANTYTGATDIEAGTLELGAADALPSGSAVTIAPGAVLDLSNLSSLTISSLAGEGNIILGNCSLTVGSPIDPTFSGVISGAGGLTYVGPGLWVLAGANTYTGGTDIEAGTLQLGAANALPSGSDVTVAAGATLDLNNYDESIGSLAGAGDVTLGSGTLTTGGDNTSTSFTGIISGTGGLTQDGAGTLTVGGASTYTGATTIDAGTLQLGAANALPSGSDVTVAAGATLDLNNYDESIGSLAGTGDVTLGSGTLTTGGDNTSTSFTGIISGMGGLTQDGTGTLTLSGPNTYMGATTIDAGTLQAGAVNALPSGSAVSLANAASAVLDLNSFDNSIASLAGGGATGGNVTLGSGTLTIANAIAGSSTTNYDGVISGTGGLTIDLTGSGRGSLTMAPPPATMILSGPNTYSGGTTISAGTLQVGDGGTSGSLGSGAISDNTTLVFDRSDSFTVGAAISGSGLVVTDSGILTLTAANNAIGTLAVGGSLIIAAGGTLTVAGDFDNFGSVTLEASSAGAGILYVGGDYSTPSSGATLTVQLGGAPASGDFGQLIVTGTANLAGTLTVQLNGYMPSSGDSFQILTDAAMNGNFGTTDLPTGAVWNPDTGTVTFS